MSSTALYSAGAMIPSVPEVSLEKPFPDHTAELLRRIHTGDEAALDLLYRRYLPRLLHWAAGRLPGSARDLLETQDLVQDTMIRSLRNLPRFEPAHDGALWAYFRKAISNRIRDEIRRSRQLPPLVELDTQAVHPGPSPLEEAVGRECADRYERALGRLKEEDQHAVILRIEFHFNYLEIAGLLGKPSSDAARMTVNRALVRLAKEMSDETRQV